MLQEKNKYSRVLFCLGILLVYISVSVFCCQIKIAFAQTVPVWGENNVAGVAMDTTGLSKSDPRIIIANIIKIFLGFLGLILLILIMYAGFLWMTAGGDDEKIIKSKAILKNSVIGLLIILSSYAITSFFLSMLGGGSGSVRVAGEPPVNAYSYLGATSDHIVESHYPAREQKDIPKNTNIVVTFREEMDLGTIINNSATGGICGDGISCGNVNFENIRIFKNSDGDSCVAGNDGYTSCNVNNITAVQVSTIDKKTFVFNPIKNMDGSADGIGYTVYLGNGLKKLNGDNAFSAVDKYDWEFFVSNNLDLTPPVIKSIFPFPDHSADTLGVGVAGVKAQWDLSVDRMPVFKADAKIIKIEIAVLENWETDNAKVSGIYDGEEDAVFIITIGSDFKAEIKLNNVVIATKTVVDNKIENFFPGLTFERDDMVAGNSWKITIEGKEEGDWININNKKYVFGEDIKESEGETAESIADKIKNAINQKQNYEVKAEINSNNNDKKKIILTSAMASAKANSWTMDTSNQNKISLSTTPAVVGINKINATSIQKGGRADWAINAVIQINFNEAIDPIAANNFIEIATSTGILEGDLIFSNQYKTVEFKPANPCGRNSCGEPIYCLPKEKQIIISIKAGELSASCVDASGCVAYDDFTQCKITGNNIQICQNDLNENYPESIFNSGMMDMCANSLDGNKNGNAEGPGSDSDSNQSNKAVFNENDLMAICSDGVKEIICSSENNDSCVLGCKYEDTTAVIAKEDRLNGLQKDQGDSYKWSFYTSSGMETGAPNISSRTPSQGASGIDAGTSLTAKFDELMMSSSLHSGTVKIEDKDNIITTHTCVELNPKKVNISVDNEEAGASLVSYWVEKEDVDNEPDGYVDDTEIIIKHSAFDLESIYEGDIGSGVKDIFQNCYNPSYGQCADDDGICTNCGEGEDCSDKVEGGN